jgi:hypothetical protein
MSGNCRRMRALQTKLIGESKLVSHQRSDERVISKRSVATVEEYCWEFRGQQEEHDHPCEYTLSLEQRNDVNLFL